MQNLFIFQDLYNRNILRLLSTAQNEMKIIPSQSEIVKDIPTVMVRDKQWPIVIFCWVGQYGRTGRNKRRLDRNLFW